MKIFKSFHEETLFRILLALSLLFYFSITVLIESVPYKPHIKKNIFKMPRKVRIARSVPRISIPVKKKVKEVIKKAVKPRKEVARPPVKTARRSRPEKIKKRVKPRKSEKMVQDIGLAGILKHERRSLQKIMKNENINKVLNINTVSVPLSKRKGHKKKLVKGPAKKEVNLDIPLLANKKFSEDFKHHIDISSLKIARIKGVVNRRNGPARTQSSIRKVVKARKGILYFLYRKALRANPTLKGKVIIEFIITEDGKVTQVKIISSTLHDSKFEHEILRRIRLWKFPPLPGSGNTIVVYPLEFERV